MEFILYSVALLAAIFLLFTAIEKPYFVASILVFFFIYNLNLELPGPLDARGLLTVVLFARLFLFDKQNYTLVKNYLLRDLNGILLIIFLVLSFYTSYSYYGGLQNLLKLNILLIVSLILGFIIVINGEGKKVFFNAIILSGILTTFDIIYSTMVYGQLQIRSFIKVLLLGDTTGGNHNAFGLICALALVLVYIFFIRKQIPKKISFILMFILSFGVLISTSRSSLIALLIVLIISFLVQKEITFNLNKVLTTSLGVIIFFVSFYFAYNTLLSSGQFKSSFIDKTYYRLYEEPMSFFGGNENQVFDKWGDKMEGTSRGRLERTMTDISKYSQLDLEIQLFGLGLKGYIFNKFGGDRYNAHNGYVLLLIERGIIGLLIFIFCIVNLSIKSFRLLRRNFIDTPIIYIFLILVFYSIGQNAELTNNLAFLFFGAIIANTKEHLISEEVKDDELVLLSLNK